MAHLPTNTWNFEKNQYREYPLLNFSDGLILCRYARARRIITSGSQSALERFERYGARDHCVWVPFGPIHLWRLVPPASPHISAGFCRIREWFTRLLIDILEGWWLRKIFWLCVWVTYPLRVWPVQFPNWQQLHVTTYRSECWVFGTWNSTPPILSHLVHSILVHSKIRIVSTVDHLSSIGGKKLVK